MIQKIAVVIALALNLAGCSDEAAKNEVDVLSDLSAVANGERPDRESLNGTGITNTPTPAQTTKDATAFNKLDDKAAMACIRVGEAEARAFADLEPMGSSGSTRIFGRPGELLCSEPGVGGRGECELVGSTVVRLESANKTYGFRSTSAAPAILIYSPTGFSCTSHGG